MVMSVRVATALGIVAVLVMLLKDSWPWSGPVLFTFAASHGVHATDIPIAMAAVAAVALVLVTGRPAPGLVPTAR